MFEEWTDEELEALRADETRCVRILAACRRFAVQLGGAAGNYATFAQNEEVLLESFAQVMAAHRGYEQLFVQRYQRAGLTAVDTILLEQRLRQYEEMDS